MRQKLTPQQILEAIKLATIGELNNVEIAQQLGLKTTGALNYHLRKNKIVNPASALKYGHWQRKYDRNQMVEIFKYFFTHTKEETLAHFKITEAHFKYALMICYKDKSLQGIRKDNRSKELWSSKDYKFLLQHTGLMSRAWIAKKMRRGNGQGIRTRLEKLNISSKNLNGITLSQFRILFGHEPEFFLQTKAGPDRMIHATYWKIVPWVWMHDQIKQKKLTIAPMFAGMIKSMALFQEWIFDGDALKKMIKIVNLKTA